MVMESRVSRNSVTPTKSRSRFSRILTRVIFLASPALVPNVRRNEFRYMYDAFPPVNGLAGLVVVHYDYLNRNDASRQTHKATVGFVVWPLIISTACICVIR